MDFWPRGDLLAGFGIVVAVILGVLALLGARRWGTRRAELSFEYEYTSLLADSGAKNLIKVMYGNMEVSDPHVLTIRIINTGSRDVTSSNFDSGKPFEVILNCAMYGLVGSVSDRGNEKNLVIQPSGMPGVLKFKPALLKRKQKWQVEALVSGRGNPSVRSPVIDTDVIQGGLVAELIRIRPSVFSNLCMALAAACFVTGLTFVIVGGISLPDSPFDDGEFAYCIDNASRSLPNGQKCDDVVRMTQESNSSPAIITGVILAMSAGVLGAVGEFSKLARRRPLVSES